MKFKTFTTQLVAILVSAGIVPLLQLGLIDWLNRVTWLVADTTLPVDKKPEAIWLLTAGALITLARNSFALLVKYFAEHPPKWYTAILNFFKPNPNAL